MPWSSLKVACESGLSPGENHAVNSGMKNRPCIQICILSTPNNISDKNSEVQTVHMATMAHNPFGGGFMIFPFRTSVVITTL